ncbi:MAG: hypothetical protein LBE82_06970, partial [Chitinophagaceae bacterium]|nr:hypothetical protein [Chitinophagaceae bacterium]
MIKKIAIQILLTLVYSISTSGQTSYIKQNTYSDALELANILDTAKKNLNGSGAAFKNIIKKYGKQSGLIDNPFLKGYLVGIDTLMPIAGLTEGHQTGWRDSIFFFGKNFFPNNPSSLTPANWQASVITGVAGFMAGRFKEEVLHIAIDRIFKQIKEEDFKIISAIFPKTFERINSLYGSGGSSYYTADLLLLRQIAQMDIELLPKNIIENSD